MIQYLIDPQECAVQQENFANQAALHSIHAHLKLQNSHGKNGNSRNIYSRNTHVFNQAVEEQTAVVSTIMTQL